MKRLISLAMFGMCLSSAFAACAIQGVQPSLAARRAVRIPIRHADPWFVKGLLEGQPLIQPEMSTIFGLFGAPPQTAGQVNGLFSGGKFLVNPTDNSLWWYPD